MSDWTEYTIRAGERNFSPMEPFWPGKPGHEALAEKAGAMTMIQALRMNGKEN